MRIRCEQVSVWRNARSKLSILFLYEITTSKLSAFSKPRVLGQSIRLILYEISGKL